MTYDGSHEADVIVVGAGPAGSAAAHYLATLGRDVIVLEKSTFPRDKVCGDGLTPGAVRELLLMGMDLDPADGWMRNKGLRVVGGGHTIMLPWPETPTYPNYGMAKARQSLDLALITHAQASGATLIENAMATAPIQLPSGRIIGVQARIKSDEYPRGRTVEFRAPVVIDAGGVSARIATAVGITKRDDRPLGVAVRTYFRTPLHDDEWMESQLELWDGPRGKSNLLPGYGWIFPLGDGTANVGLGSVSSTARATRLDYKAIFRAWMQNAPASWQFTPDNQVGPLRSAALPMAYNRTPHYRQGLMLVGDAGGMVSPFNGEGITYALKAGRIAAEVIHLALARTSAYGTEKTLRTYPREMATAHGGYFALGRSFVKLIEHPEIMRICTRYGLTRPTLMRFVHKLLSDGYEHRGGDAMDRLIAALTRIVPTS
ncbi:MAG: geranylgeranyl reductase family protein [Bowdeniella nasicola]|nr:geranylgeranyl reductase family protein [Bowdeniella nasicola]